MTSNDPLDPHGADSRAGDTHTFGGLQISAGRQTAHITVDLILYVIVVLGVLIASAIVDEDSGPGFGAAQAWFYVTLLTIGFLISRGLAKINSRGDSNRVL